MESHCGQPGLHSDTFICFRKNSNVLVTFLSTMGMSVGSNFISQEKKTKKEETSKTSHGFLTLE